MINKKSLSIYLFSLFLGFGQLYASTKIVSFEIADDGKEEVRPRAVKATTSGGERALVPISKSKKQELFDLGVKKTPNPSSSSKDLKKGKRKIDISHTFGSPNRTLELTGLRPERFAGKEAEAALAPMRAIIDSLDEDNVPAIADVVNNPDPLDVLDAISSKPVDLELISAQKRFNDMAQDVNYQAIDHEDLFNYFTDYKHFEAIVKRNSQLYKIVDEVRYIFQTSFCDKKFACEAQGFCDFLNERDYLSIKINLIRLISYIFQAVNTIDITIDKLGKDPIFDKSINSLKIKAELVKKAIIIEIQHYLVGIRSRFNEQYESFIKFMHCKGSCCPQLLQAEQAKLKQAIADFVDDTFFIKYYAGLRRLEIDTLLCSGPGLITLAEAVQLPYLPIIKMARTKFCSRENLINGTIQHCIELWCKNDKNFVRTIKGILFELAFASWYKAANPKDRISFMGKYLWLNEAFRKSFSKEIDLCSHKFLFELKNKKRLSAGDFEQLEQLKTINQSLEEPKCFALVSCNNLSDDEYNKLNSLEISYVCPGKSIILNGADKVDFNGLYEFWNLHYNDILIYEKSLDRSRARAHSLINRSEINPIGLLIHRAEQPIMETQNKKSKSKEESKEEAKPKKRKSRKK